MQITVSALGLLICKKVPDGQQVVLRALRVPDVGQRVVVALAENRGVN
jgi:hypothetical protein